MAKSWVLAQPVRFDAALLGSLGFSSKYIQRKTGLTTGQITYTLRKANVYRREFRDGESPEAKALLRHYHDVAADTLQRRWPLKAKDMAQVAA